MIIIGLFILVSVLSLCSCSNGETHYKFTINGAWRLKSVVYNTGYERNFDADSRLRVYDDTCFYECYIASAPTGNMIVPREMQHYSLVEKGKNEYFYMQDDNTHPLNRENDTVIVIQQTGCLFTWEKTDEFDDKRLMDIVNIIKTETKKDSETPTCYVFSYAEQELETKNSLLTYLLIAIILVILNYAFYSYKKKKKVRRELQQIEQEQQSLPDLMREARNTVEDEFHHSDFYISLHRKIANGERLSKDDWSGIEEQFKSVYPRFASTLFNLHNMSQVEFQVCLLLKLNVNPSEMSNVLCKDKSSISNIRRRLYEKIFDKKGTGKDWDEFISSL